MDSKLQFRGHIAHAATKGLKAAMTLRRLRTISPPTARGLFIAMVTPTIDYASSLRMHRCSGNKLAMLNRPQRVGAQAIAGAFRTVVTVIAEAKACISNIHDRHIKKAVSLWVYLHTLPRTNPLSRISTAVCIRFTSPLQRIAQICEDVLVDKMETIQPYIVTPWESRIASITDPEEAKAIIKHSSGVVIVTSSSVKNEIVGMGSITYTTNQHTLNQEPTSLLVTLGLLTEQNPYTAELTAIAKSMEKIA
ncbi:hypothetical protein B7463_g9880, partial [Scytalidium lignicola]